MGVFSEVPTLDQLQQMAALQRPGQRKKGPSQVQDLGSAEDVLKAKFMAGVDVAGGPGAQAQGLGGGTSIAEMGFPTPPPSRQYLDEDRARSAPAGVSLEKALKAGGGFALEGPGGYFASNADRDRARAVSNNPLDQFETFKDLARRAGVTTGPAGNAPPDALMRMFGGYQGMVNQGKTAQAALEEQLGKQYGQTTRGIQEDANRIATSLIQGKSHVESEKLRGEAARDVTKSNVKGQMSSEKAKMIGGLLEQGRVEEAKALGRTYGQIEKEMEDQKRGGQAGGPAGSPAPAPAPDPYKDSASARAMQALGVQLGFRTKGKDKAGNEQFNPFDADVAVSEIIKNPKLLDDPALAEMFQQGGGGAAPHVVREALRNRLIRGALPPSGLNGLKSVKVGDLTINPTQSGLTNTYEILGPYGQTLDSTSAYDLPGREWLGGTRRFFPRTFADPRQVQRENETASMLLKKVHGLK